MSSSDSLDPYEAGIQRRTIPGMGGNILANG